MKLADVRIARDEVLFHPKVYIFTKGNNKAVFIGSSNFTYQGFYKNHEVNVLIEKATDKEIQTLEASLARWRTKDYSFVPTDKWLDKYTALYNKRRVKIKREGLGDEAEIEEDASESSAWLAVADWDVYLRKVNNGINHHHEKFYEGRDYKLNFFKTIATELPQPWSITYFDDIVKRRILGGMRPYGLLGHVAASGAFRKLLAKGTSVQYRIIVKAINSIAQLQNPLDQRKLQKNLDSLVELGPTMKVWGRLLALVRPDLFCTISAPQVRRNIAKTLDKPEKYFQSVEGYLILLSIIHKSPWYNSPKPNNKTQLDIWNRRVAFLDVVFYK